MIHRKSAGRESAKRKSAERESAKRKSAEREFAGIDWFRLAAAVLIVAIHTSPLASVSALGDFILTRAAARTAVPFFMMTSGFFLISRYQKDDEKLRRFLKRTARIYLSAILFYIPINLYNGYFHAKELLPKLIFDLVFNGTLYHLWYLPASMLGALIAWKAARSLSAGGALAVTGALYAVGLFGDSYYEIAAQIPAFKGFYDFIFQVSDYTRNGVFFAPLFFVLGGVIADRRRLLSLKMSCFGFACAFLFMLSEALLLRAFGLQRHDSMYVFLPVCMFFAFHAILHVRGRRPAGLRTLALLIYIIHPMVIVGVRLLAKLLRLQNLLIDNSVLHFLLVAAFSLAAGAAGTFLWERRQAGRTTYQKHTDRAWIEINLHNLEHNVKMLQRQMPQKAELMAVVKTNAYGHGAFEIAAHLNKIGVRAFAAATIDEGIALRKAGIIGEILILGYTNVCRARELKKYRLTQTVIDLAYAGALNRQGVRVNVHIKVDTGMHRLGIPAYETDDIEAVFFMENLNVTGMYTHLCCADSQEPEDIAFTQEQIGQFYETVEVLRKDGVAVPKLHVQNSAGLLCYPEISCDYVRAGIALYGAFAIQNRQSGEKCFMDLRPVLSLKARVVLVREVAKGENIGYDRAYTAKHAMRIAVLSVGYGDGVPRNLSGSGYVLLKGRLVPIVGRICMDSLTVDVTDMKENEEIETGDTAALIGAGIHTKLPATQVAAEAGSISNELLCRLGARLPVVVK